MTNEERAILDHPKARQLAAVSDVDKNIWLVRGQCPLACHGKSGPIYVRDFGLI
jgi:hypothetical protein